MAVSLNTTLRNVAADALAAQFNGGTLVIRTGTAPAVGSAETGTLLATVNLPNPAFGAAASGVATKAGVWSATAAATGAPSYFRIKNPAGTNVMQGTAGTSGTDMILTGLVGGQIEAGGTVTVSAFSLTQPAS